MSRLRVIVKFNQKIKFKLNKNEIKSQILRFLFEIMMIFLK